MSSENPSLRVVLVTSRVTFVPENYNRLVCGLANSPYITGCIVIDNRNWRIALQAIALLLTTAAPRMGWHLLKNYFVDALNSKRAAYTSLGKSFDVIHDLNSEEALLLLKNNQIDLVLNARTRTFFKKKLLATPRLGCINIHHGLLPDQRGLMCDFWAHLENTPAGFTIHQMTSKLDDGVILKAVEVKTDQSNYMHSILHGSELEVLACEEVLRAIADQQSVVGAENLLSPNTVYRKNPALPDFFKLRKRGTRI